MSQKPLVSIIVVNWNGLKTIEKCLDSLLAQTYSNREIIVVENDSRDGSREILASLYGRKITLIQNEENEGFARGNNIGIQASSGEYIGLLNNDAWADSRWVESLVRTALKDPAIGMCASKIYLAGEDRLLDNAGLLFYPDGLGWGRGRLERDTGQYDREEEVIFPSGCAALYKKAMLGEIGLFDERFFAYCEDTDLGLRGRLSGWRCIYSPSAVVYHHFSGSTSGASKLKAFSVERNRGWVAVKNLPLRFLFLSPWFTLKRYVWQLYGIFSGVGLSGQYVRQYSFFSGIMMLLRAYGSMVKGLPYMLRQRRVIQKKRKISTQDLAGLIRRFQASPRNLALGQEWSAG